MRNKLSLLWAFALLAALAGTARSAAAQQTANANPGGGSSENECQSPVTISGAVTAPGRFELRRRVRLNELLAFAGGLTPRAEGTIEILHAASTALCKKDAPADLNKPPLDTPETYKITDLLAGDERANPYLSPGDIVKVSEAEPVYVVGRVAVPQPLYLRDGMTLMRALAMVGGVLKSARTEKISIFRRTSGDLIKPIYVNINEIKKGRRQDIPLQPYDVVDVPDKRDRHQGGHPGPPLYVKPERFVDKDKSPGPRIIY